MRFLALAILLLFTSESFAYQPKKGNVTATLGPAIFQTNFGGASPNFEDARRTGVGLTALGDFSDKGSLEISMFTVHKTYLRAEAGKYLAQKAETVHITMGYRHWWSSIFSTSLTFFSAYTLGNPNTIYSEFAAGSEIDTSASDNTEYGFDFAAQVEMLTYKQLALVMEGRYSLSLTKKEMEHADHYGVYFGIRFPIAH